MHHPGFRLVQYFLDLLRHQLLLYVVNDQKRALLVIVESDLLFELEHVVNLIHRSDRGQLREALQRTFVIFSDLLFYATSRDE